MQKYLKEMKLKNPEEWAHLVKYMTANHSDSFCVLSWGEIEKIVNYCREYQFQLDFHKTMRSFEVPALEEGIINSMINTTRSNRIEQKQKAHHNATERTKRLIDAYMHNLEVNREIEKLRSTMKAPRSTNNIKADFEKLKGDIL
ncbi:MAG: hypothetical protein CSH49_07800 [Alcanivorax sp.]|nr:MAG: hypothetical protein CSH49_07800 [Alcanivorax sp.]